MGLGWSEAFVWVPQQSGALMGTDRPMGEEEGGLGCAGSLARGSRGFPGKGPRMRGSVAEALAPPLEGWAPGPTWQESGGPKGMRLAAAAAWKASLVYRASHRLSWERPPHRSRQTGCLGSQAPERPEGSKRTPDGTALMGPEGGSGLAQQERTGLPEAGGLARPLSCS